MEREGARNKGNGKKVKKHTVVLKKLAMVIRTE